MTNDRPRLQAPPGATDTHMHFYDTAERYPVAPTVAFLPPPAPIHAALTVSPILEGGSGPYIT
jgi:hypothetical protein